MTPTLFDSATPIGIAHRGSRLLWPENTHMAFEGAEKLGSRFFETDVRVTADGELVCFHDADLSRTTDGSGRLTGTSWEEAARLDAGYRHQLDGGFPFRGRGLRIPRFVDLVSRFPEAGLVVDLKADSSVEPLVDLITSLSLRSRIIVGSFSDSRLDRFRNLTDNDVPTSAGPNEILRGIRDGRLGRVLHGPADAFQVPISWYGIPIVDRKFVEGAHDAGKLVHVWTINRPAEMEYLLDLGVDGIITDRPDVLAPFLAG